MILVVERGERPTHRHDDAPADLPGLAVHGAVVGPVRRRQIVKCCRHAHIAPRNGQRKPLGDPPKVGRPHRRVAGLNNSHGLFDRPAIAAQQPVQQDARSAGAARLGGRTPPAGPGHALIEEEIPGHGRDESAERDGATITAQNNPVVLQQGHLHLGREILGIGS